MGRWRPPPPQSSAIITRAGFERLRAELEELWTLRRPEVVSALAAAAAEGDRSENAEYTYRKKQLGEIDRRVRYLSKRLPALRVVDTAPSDPERIFFGAHLELEWLDIEEAFACRIVGPDETDAKLGHISVDSPLARALLGRRIDECVEARLPSGVREVLVVSVRYGGSTDSP